MGREQKITSSVYRKVAIDIAKNIAEEKYIVGQKLYGRSVLASHYGVSPETIRKAVHLLKDVCILDTEKGSGIEVKSTEKAKDFIKLQSEIENVSTVKNELITWAKDQMKEMEDIIDKIQFISDATERFKNADPFVPYEIKITSDSIAIGKTVDDLRFWHNTEGTIIAIRRDGHLIISPGPYATFNEGDVFYIVGNDKAYAAAMKLIFGSHSEQSALASDTQLT